MLKSDESRVPKSEDVSRESKSANKDKKNSTIGQHELSEYWMLTYVVTNDYTFPNIVVRIQRIPVLFNFQFYNMQTDDLPLILQD